MVCCIPAVCMHNIDNDVMYIMCVRQLAIYLHLVSGVNKDVFTLCKHAVKLD